MQYLVSGHYEMIVDADSPDEAINYALDHGGWNYEAVEHEVRSKYTVADMKVREEALTTGQFEGNGGYSGKIQCTTCGAQGYPGGSWMDRCILGHTKCPDCPRVVPTSSLKKHRNHRSHP